MTVTTTTLTRAAGIAAAAAGLIFIGVQINHPHLDTTSITTTEVAIRNSLKVLMAALALAGITGIYLRQVRQAGVLGLAGYLLLGAFYLLIVPIEFIAAYVLPSIAGTDPSYVKDVIAAATGGTPTGDIGVLGTVIQVQGLTYLAGGLVFGIALYRAGVLARWAAALLAVGTVATLALSVLPESFNRPFAVPTGVALIGLGISLWRDQRRSTAPATTTTSPARQHAVR
jgi:hypothetical protein